MQRFYWLVDGELAGCSLPGGSPRGDADRHAPGHSDEHLNAVEADLSWLRQQNIGAILSLTEEPLPARALQRQQLESLHLPVPDMTAPLPYQFCAALDFIDRWRSHGRGVAVHCLMGQGRTGAILAAYLIRTGVQAPDAVEQLRVLCPGALASPAQEHALTAYSARRDWML
jgi:atypical dual specificity phosphatase